MRQINMRLDSIKWVWGLTLKITAEMQGFLNSTSKPKTYRKLFLLKRNNSADICLIARKHLDKLLDHKIFAIPVKRIKEAVVMVS